MFTYRRPIKRRRIRRRLQTRPTPLLGLINCQRLHARPHGNRTDGRKSALAAGMLSCFFYRAMHYALRGIATVSRPHVRPSVRPSVTLIFRGHINWVSFYVITWLINLSLYHNIAIRLRQDYDKTTTRLRRSRRRGWWIAYISIAIRLRYDYDTMIPRRIRRLRKWSKLWFDCDTTSTSLRRKIDMLIFCSRGMETGARERRGRMVVVS